MSSPTSPPPGIPATSSSNGFVCVPPHTMTDQAPNTRPITSQPFTTSSLSFMSNLNVLYMTKITNNPIFHDSIQPTMPTNIPSKVPKFDGKASEDLCNHIIYFHMQCSYNNITDDYTQSCLFKCTLTRVANKWHIDKPTNVHTTFSSLTYVSLTFFQLLVHYDEGLDILLTCIQFKATQIMDHPREWH